MSIDHIETNTLRKQIKNMTPTHSLQLIFAHIFPLAGADFIIICAKKKSCGVVGQNRMMMENVAKSIFAIFLFLFAIDYTIHIYIMTKFTQTSKPHMFNLAFFIV